MKLTPVIHNNSTKAPHDGSDALTALANELVAAIGHEDFFAVLARRLARFFPYEWLIIFLYRCGATPILLHDTMSPQLSHEGISNYLRNTYVLSPVYRAFLGGIEPGLYFMRDLVPRESLKGLDAEQFGVRIDRKEEIGFLTAGLAEGNAGIAAGVSGLARGTYRDLVIHKLSERRRGECEPGASAKNLPLAADLHPQALGDQIG